MMLLFDFLCEAWRQKTKKVTQKGLFLEDLNVRKYGHKCTCLTIKIWNFLGIKQNLRYHLVHPGGL